MNFLRSICCLFGASCPSEHREPTKETARTEPPGPERPPPPPPPATGPQATGGGSQATGAAERQTLKALIRLEGAHAFCVSIFGGVEHLRADF
jgi:hypothetical protein